MELARVGARRPRIERAVEVAAGVATAVSVAVVVLSVMFLLRFDRYADMLPDGSAKVREIEDVFVNTTTLWQLAALAVAIAIAWWSVWVARAGATSAHRAPPRPRWLVVAWLVPVVDLIVPFLVLLRSAGGRRRATRAVVTWEVTFVSAALVGFAALLAFGSYDEETFEPQGAVVATGILAAIAFTLFAAAGVATIAMVRTLSLQAREIEAAAPLPPVAAWAVDQPAPRLAMPAAPTEVTRPRSWKDNLRRSVRVRTIALAITAGVVLVVGGVALADGDRGFLAACAVALLAVAAIGVYLRRRYTRALQNPFIPPPEAVELRPPPDFSGITSAVVIAADCIAKRRRSGWRWVWTDALDSVFAREVGDEDGTETCLYLHDREGHALDFRELDLPGVVRVIAPAVERRRAAGMLRIDALTAAVLGLTPDDPPPEWWASPLNTIWR